ncbi:MAG: RsmB/NOP family class I SAM-dependent RNA methyltransferase [Deltaproteobacteria bacterium]|nr:RsmB/NOP family class I SAM-dependent RNA methyltransferase [Deltaproteobacteria bacterium]MBW2070266.1 RsmB/NOP family class I SAM-dependent RNA methyltransferase [Deltaproteobacteria bacterium]
MNCLQPEIVNKVAELFAAYQGIIPDYAAFCRRVCQPLPLYLRINTLKTTVGAARSRLEQRGVLLEPVAELAFLFKAAGVEQPGHLFEFALGHIHSQTYTSALAAVVLEAAAGHVVLDLCASPGSKTTLLAQLMGNRGLIVANDKSTARLVALRSNLKRLGVANTITTRYGGQHFPGRCKFDRILVDVPCSAEGSLRLTSTGKLPRRQRRISRLPSLQKQLLVRAFDLLKPQGILLYSTCTYNPDENESVVQFLLENRPAVILPIRLAVPHAPGLSCWRALNYETSLKECWRFYPHQVDSVGFFMAKIAPRC